ncbi:MAG: DMT family transporter, partial [Acidimicrobiia bacterium]
MGRGEGISRRLPAPGDRSRTGRPALPGVDRRLRGGGQLTGRRITGTGAERTLGDGSAAPSPTTRSGLDRLPVWALILVTSAIWGGNFVGMKVALRSSTPLLLATGRSLVGGTLLVAIGVARRQRLPNRAELRMIAWAALFMTTVSTAALTAGVARVTAGLASLLVNTMPLFLVMLAAPLLGERPGRKALIGLAIGFGGTAVIALPALQGSTSMTGVALVLLAAFTWALGSLILKRSDLSGLHPMVAVGFQLLLSSGGLALLTLALEPSRSIVVTPAFLATFVEITAIGLAMVWVFWVEILRRASTAQAGATAYLVPLFGVAFGVIFLGEALLLLEAVGAVLV